MLSRFHLLNNFYKSSGGYAVHHSQIQPLVAKKPYATYDMQKVNPLTSSHELAKDNPILGKEGFQHPGIGGNACVMPDCEHKLCDELCGPSKEKTHVGHGTHDGTRKEVIYVSPVDFNGANQLQYAKLYAQPIINNDTQGVNIDHTKTPELRKNQEMLDNIHVNTSREPVQFTNTGSDDPANIN